MKYCEISDVENYMLQDIDSSYESQVNLYIEGVSKMMDNMANRKLVEESEEEQTRYYDGNGSDSIIIDDAQSVSQVSVGDYYGDDLEALNAEDYLLYPKNAPHSQIFIKDDIFPTGKQNIAVKGIFGLVDDIPADIRLACTIIVAGILNANNPTNANKKSESIGNYSVTYSDDRGLNDYNNALSIINAYKKYTI